MQHFAAVRNTVLGVIVLATLHLILFNDLFGKINTLRSDVMKAIKVSSPLEVKPSIYLVEDAEKWNNFFLINNIPIGL
jgi:hypothetical protein